MGSEIKRVCLGGNWKSEEHVLPQSLWKKPRDLGFSPVILISDLWPPELKESTFPMLSQVL